MHYPNLNGCNLRMLLEKYIQVWSCFKENTLQNIAEVKTRQKMKV